MTTKLYLPMQISVRSNTEPTGNENSRLGSAALLQLAFLSQSNPDDFSVTKRKKMRERKKREKEGKKERKKKERAKEKRQREKKKRKKKREKKEEREREIMMKYM